MVATIGAERLDERQAARRDDHQAPATPPPGEWLPITEAAGRLGLSADAVRRRARRKQLRTRRVPTEHGGPARYEVWCPTPPSGDPPGERQADGVAAPGDRQAHQAERQAESFALAQVRAHEMAAYTESLLSPWRTQVSALSERCGRLEAELEDARRHLAEHQAERQAAATRPWWRFW
jgi:hypothetical protein